LAFVFFFILLIFSAFRFNELDKQILEEKEKLIEVTQSATQSAMALMEIKESFEMAANQAGLDDVSDPDELFQQLVLAKSEARKAQKVSLQHKPLSEAVARAGKELGVLGENSESTIEKILQTIKDTKGQNINLRNKLGKLGNGLDHPPCWADPITGKIQYVFNVIINETSVKFLSGWAPSRRTQAVNNPSIIRVLGTYRSNSDLWVQSEALYQESVSAECRHFVRVFDHATSKNAYKSYLLGIENHFYKFISRSLHE